MAFNVDNIKKRDAGELSKFCPLMKQTCTRGWTKDMGKTAGVPNFGACAAWQPVTLRDVKAGETFTARACSVFETNAGMLAEIAKETAEAGASSDKVATEVQAFHATSIAVMPEPVRVELMARNPRLTGGAAPLSLEDRSNGH